jgi:hypothetical protein
MAREFTLVFEDAENADGPTEIYIPEDREYPDGWQVEVGDPAGSWSWEWDADANVLSIWTTPSTAAHTIVVAPAK